MRFKKILALLAALSVMGSLTACSKEESSQTSTAEESSLAEESSAEENSTEITESPETTEATTTTEAPLPAPDASAITFDTPSLYTAHAMGGGDDEADVQLDVVDLKGDKKLRVQVKANDDGKYDVPKIVFDLPELLGSTEAVASIGHISVDFTCVARGTWKNDDDTESLVVGNFLGALAGNLAEEKKKEGEDLVQNEWATHTEFSLSDWDNPEHSWHVETDVPALLPINGYSSDEGTTLVIMRWAQDNAVDFYIDNLTFFDKDGKAIPVAFDAASAPAEVLEDKGAEVPEETTGAESAAEETTAS